jgi:hypothetical protein
MTSFSGYILASTEAREFAREEFEQPESEEPRGPRFLHFRSNQFGLKRWDEYRLHSTRPLADEPHGQPDYPYQVYLVRGFGKLVILAMTRKIVDFTLSQILDRTIFPNLQKVSVFVDQMIEFCRKPESPFLVTSLHGRFAGPSPHLKSISLYGDDVTQSSLYEEQRLLFNFHSGGVGRRLYDGLPRLRSEEEREIVRISGSGAVSLNLTTRRRAKELLEVVNFVVTHRWVEEWVPIPPGETAWPT